MKNIQNYMKNYMMINNGCSMIDKYCGLVEEIKNLSTQLQRGEFRHIMREPNNLANSFVKHGVNLECDWCIFKDLP